MDILDKWKDGYEEMKLKVMGKQLSRAQKVIKKADATLKKAKDANNNTGAARDAKRRDISKQVKQVLGRKGKKDKHIPSSNAMPKTPKDK